MSYIYIQFNSLCHPDPEIRGKGGSLRASFWSKNMGGGLPPRGPSPGSSAGDSGADARIQIRRGSKLWWVKGYSLVNFIFVDPYMPSRNAVNNFIHMALVRPVTENVSGLHDGCI